MQLTLTSAEFWQYACNRYSEKAVQQACLLLQDKLGANVNLLLLLSYCRQQGYSLTSPQIALLHQGVNVFSQPYTQEIRGIRRQVTADDNLTSAQQAELKQQLLTSELACEKIEQAKLLEKLSSLKIHRVEQAQSTCLINRYLLQLTQQNKHPIPTESWQAAYQAMIKSA